MGSDVGQIFPTASLHRDHSISYALECEKEISYIGKLRKSRSGVREKFLTRVCLAYYTMYYNVKPGYR